MKTALVTGVTGQDGAYLSHLLLSKGYRVHGTTRPTGPVHDRNLTTLGVRDAVTLHPVHLLDSAAVLRLLDDLAPDEVYHLAAQSSVGLSFEQPIPTLEFNALSTAHLLDGLRVTGAARRDVRFYQASSSEMYGRLDRLPVTERSVLHPVSPYAISKAAAHWTAVNYREAYGLFSCSGILFNHESALRPGRFVTKKVVSAAVDASEGKLGRLNLGNATVQRDWGYAPDYVECMWRMLQHDTPSDYVIATGEARALREFVDAAFDAVELDAGDFVETDPALFRPLDIDVIYGDASKARDTLGWHYDRSFGDLVRQLVADEQSLRAGRPLVAPLPSAEP